VLRITVRCPNGCSERSTRRPESLVACVRSCILIKVGVQATCAWDMSSIAARSREVDLEAMFD